MNKNTIESVAKQGEWAKSRKALVTKDLVAWMRRLRDEGVRSYMGRSRLVPERATALPKQEVSKGRSSCRWGR